MNDAIGTIQRAAGLVKRWGHTQLPNGETLENFLVVDGVSLWTAMAPVLAAFSLPKALTRKTPLPFFSRVVRPYLSGKKHQMQSFGALKFSSSGLDRWPSAPVCLFLGFSGYMYRDVLAPVVNRLAEDYQMNYMVLHDDGRFQESAVKLEGERIQSIWVHSDKEVAAHASRLRGALSTKLRYLRNKKILPTLVENEDNALWSQVEATFKWLFIYMPSLIPYLALTRHILEIHHPVIIISPDVADPRTRLFCLMGRLLGIPALEIQFGMYGDASVEWQFFVADRVAAWGESARQVFLSHGVSEERIELTGSPRFDALNNKKEKEMTECRSRLKIPDGNMVVLFASQYSMTHYSEFGNYTEMLASTKRSLFRVVDSIDGLSLIVKPHPIENVRETMLLATGFKNIVWAERSEDIRELIRACDVFVTLGSTSTMDALIAGKLVVFAAFPGLVWWDDLYLKNGVTHEVSSEEELVECLQSVVDGQGEQLLDKLGPARQAFLQEQVYRTDGQSASRITTLAIRMAGLAERDIAPLVAADLYNG